MSLQEKLLRAIRRKKPRSLSITGYTESAVLAPLIQKRGQLHLLFTKRTDQVKDHKNQISFPGGVREKNDKSLLETALRESQEEIGLEPESVRILGRLDDIFTPTKYRIAPFVGVVNSPFSLKLNPQEIRQVILVPLRHLLQPKNLTLDPVEFFDRRFDIPFFKYKNHLIWGATGRITLELIRLVKKNGGH